MAEISPRGRSGAARPPAGSGRRTVYLIAALVLAPIVGSYIAYYFVPREVRVNYGMLLPTVPAPAIEGTRADGSPFRLEDVRGRWVLLGSGGAGCDSACERRLYASRQARTMQGKDQDRIVRVWLVVGDAMPAATFLAQHPGLIAVRVANTTPDRLPGGSGQLYLIDPLGNFVLRYPNDPDVRGIANDLARLLRASRIG